MRKTIVEEEKLSNVYVGCGGGKNGPIIIITCTQFSWVDSWSIILLWKVKDWFPFNPQVQTSPLHTI